MAGQEATVRGMLEDMVTQKRLESSNVRDGIVVIDDCSDSGAFSPLPRPPPPRPGWRSTATEALECFTRKKNTGGCLLFPKQFKILVSLHTNMLLTKNECQR